MWDRLSIILLLLAPELAGTCLASDSSRIDISIKYKNQVMDIRENTVFSYQESTLIISTFKFYLGTGSYWHLVDANNATTLQFSLPSLPDDHHTLTIGVDSLTNVSGAMGGDLDPTRGMYWTWQSGYIGLKLEGSSPLCPTRNHAFRFHLGGYTPPASFPLAFRLHKRSAAIELEIDLSVFFDHTDLAVVHTVMSPGHTAADLMKLFTTCFRVHEKN